MAMIINTDHVLMRMLKLLLMTITDDVDGVSMRMLMLLLMMLILRAMTMMRVTEPVSPTTPGLAG